MYHYTTILREVILAVTLASIFTISLVTLLKVIKKAGFFLGKSGILVAVSLSVLLLVALFCFLVDSQAAYDAGESGGVMIAAGQSLLPALALGIASAILLSQVLVLANKTPAKESFLEISGNTTPCTDEPKKTKVKPKLGRPKNKKAGS